MRACRFVLPVVFLCVAYLTAVYPGTERPEKRPNILYIMSDDHAAHALSCYDSKINKTPKKPDDWRNSMYYRYYEFPGAHSVRRHYGVRTERHKLIYFNEIGEWELYDLEKDPHEMKSVYDDPAYAGAVKDLKKEIERLRKLYKDDDTIRGQPIPKPGPKRQPKKKKKK